jgi:glutathione S-transferase
MLPVAEGAQGRGDRRQGVRTPGGGSERKELVVVVQLLDSDVHTKDVKTWKGLHVFHAPSSSCSQKLRVYLNLKGIEWQSHVIDLAKGENLSEFYLGVNPRGLVPTLVDDGAVHIESNDIILYLESRFPEPPLVPVAGASELAALLRHEDDLHLDLRTITLRFLVDTKVPIRSEQDLVRYGTTGSGTVGGKRDENISHQISFWRGVLDNGIPTEDVQRSLRRFRAQFEELDRSLRGAEYLLGERLTVLDIAWIIYVARLELAGYPLSALHPNLSEWFKKQITRPEIAREIQLPPEALAGIAEHARDLADRRQSLPDLMPA